MLIFSLVLSLILSSFILFYHSLHQVPADSAFFHTTYFQCLNYLSDPFSNFSSTSMSSLHWTQTPDVSHWCYVEGERLPSLSLLATIFLSQARVLLIPFTPWENCLLMSKFVSTRPLRSSPAKLLFSHSVQTCIVARGNSLRNRTGHFLLLDVMRLLSAHFCRLSVSL